ncbi:hypothetical protein RHMOL_Rhmol12G0014700 [Rhododendron molle]|uniref:Uncharacterized protein n=1 Tax=Rhododendron molle TaxID=49168 RepID=A0ACC0LEI4_RHOML|nr:hypothetical protein RHMOL_Rhmol12G0014700 [Rhododendron molle]
MLKLEQRKLHKMRQQLESIMKFIWPLDQPNLGDPIGDGEWSDIQDFDELYVDKYYVSSTIMLIFIQMMGT